MTSTTSSGRTILDHPLQDQNFQFLASAKKINGAGNGTVEEVERLFRLPPLVVLPCNWAKLRTYLVVVFPAAIDLIEAQKQIGDGWAITTPSLAMFDHTKQMLQGMRGGSILLGAIQKHPLRADDWAFACSKFTSERNREEPKSPAQPFPYGVKVMKFPASETEWANPEEVLRQFKRPPLAIVTWSTLRRDHFFLIYSTEAEVKTLQKEAGTKWQIERVNPNTMPKLKMGLKDLREGNILLHGLDERPFTSKSWQATSARYRQAVMESGTESGGSASTAFTTQMTQENVWEQEEKVLRLMDTLRSIRAAVVERPVMVDAGVGTEDAMQNRTEDELRVARERCERLEKERDALRAVLARMSTVEPGMTSAYKELEAACTAAIAKCNARS